MSKCRQLRENDSAVSPVIGVILMVVITVVLAASIAVFSFGFAESQPNLKSVAVKVERADNTNIVVKLMGCMETYKLLFDDAGTPNGNYGETPAGAYGSFNVSVNDVEVSNLASVGSTHITSSIGSVQYFSPVPPDSNVMIIANFKDGSKAVIWEGIVP